MLLSIEQRTGEPPTVKDYLAQNVSSAQGKKPGLAPLPLCLTSRFITLRRLLQAPGPAPQDPGREDKSLNACIKGRL